MAASKARRNFPNPDPRLPEGTALGRGDYDPDDQQRILLKSNDLVAPKKCCLGPGRIENCRHPRRLKRLGDCQYEGENKEEICRRTNSRDCF
jgi:hypothetical protein